MSLQLPADFAASIKKSLGTAYPAFLDALDEEPPVSIRLNPHKKIPDTGTAVPWCSTGRYLPSRPVFTTDPFLHAGAYYVQEASSMFLEQAIVQHVDRSRPLRVLDVSAAPGGKSTHLLSLISADSILVANEVIRSRASILSENIQKWGYPNVVVTSNDPQDFGRLAGFFDVIVLDAPCSGEGLFRKDKDAMQEWSPRHVQLCAQRQERILHDVWPSLKENGVLIYSTCTYEEAENLDQLIRVTKVYDAECLQLEIPDPWNIAVLKKEDASGYQLYPHLVKGEGFFLGALRKKSTQDNARRGGYKKQVQTPSSTVISQVSAWVDDPAKCFWIQHGETVHMMPEGMRVDWPILQSSLNVVYAGTAVGTVTRNKIIPEHSLALSIRLQKESHPTHELSIDDALQYLRKNPIAVEAPEGMTLVTYGGLGLGWLNVLKNRSNNLYPVNWRIRNL